MKAVRIATYGGNEVLQLQDEVEKPILGKGQVLVQVHAASLNQFDITVRSGALQSIMPLELPAIMGGDFAGTVKELAEGVTELKVGDKVYGQAILFNGGSGAFAQFAAVNTKNAAIMPDSIDFVTVASAPLVGCSAIQALEEHIKIKRGQKILIHGGAGGIGHIAVQLAKSLGAYVATTVSSEATSFVTKLGADEVIDYKTQKFEEILHDYDAVYDTVGGEITSKSFQVLKKGGILVSMLGEPDAQLAKKYGVTAIGQKTSTDTKKLTRLAELIDNGKITMKVDKVFPWAKIQEAYDYLENSHPKGKVAIKM